ncbi:hypothetical protein EVAR_87245_1 [Eumeta japonica]|uniref:Uncharacterized protein n=1 Tax=Eumeta variegata TaxID=151549 RepID=A0A4C1YL50_EUMVA|nr:hypothetical protein EVAR_87245_1 [Eumeta japonica]
MFIVHVRICSPCVPAESGGRGSSGGAWARTSERRRPHKLGVRSFASPLCYCLTLYHGLTSLTSRRVWPLSPPRWLDADWALLMISVTNGANSLTCPPSDNKKGFGPAQLGVPFTRSADYALGVLWTNVFINLTANRRRRRGVGCRVSGDAPATGRPDALVLGCYFENY